MTFTEAYADWLAWSTTADRYWDGWRSDYPGFSLLMELAESIMVKSAPTEQEVDFVDDCFFISEEGEWLAEFAKENIDACFPILTRLAKAKNRDTRWQVSTALPFAGEKARGLLLEAMQDKDEYCRRRAAFALQTLDASLASGDPAQYFYERRLEL